MNEVDLRMTDDRAAASTTKSTRKEDDGFARALVRVHRRRLALGAALLLTFVAYVLAGSIADEGTRSFARQTLRYVGLAIGAVFATSLSAKDEARYEDWKRRRRR